MRTSSAPRARPQRGGPNDDPPWFDVNSRVDAAPGAFSVQMADFPDIRMVRSFVDLSRTLFFVTPQAPTGQREDIPAFGPLRGAVDVRNVVDRGRRRIRFNTWLVARRARPPA